MNQKSIVKRILAVALSIIMVLGLMPVTAFADGTYTFPSYSQSGDNNSVLRYYLTDENAGDVAITELRADVQISLALNTGWYFDRWETYFNGYEDISGWFDSEVKGNNPVNDNGYYTFYNINQFSPFVNESGFPYVTIAIKKGTGFYGDHSVTAVLKPILTVNAGDGVSYQIATNNPSYTKLAANQVAVKYEDNATVTYTVDNKYVVTGVSANYGTNYSDDGAKVTVNSIKKPATVSISTKLKQQNVIFNANGGEGTMSTQVFEHSVAQTLTENNFTKVGYTFAGWNTKSDGSGAAYTDKQSLTFTPANDGESITLYAQWERSNYTVSFDANGGEAIAPITVTFGEKYGSLPSSSVAGLSGGNKNWYLVDTDGNVTETNIKNLTLVSTAREHKLFIKRNVLAPTVSIALTVPGGISDGYQYYIPGASQRVLTATVGNMNTELLNYTYQWYKDGAPIEGAAASVLTLDGNVADSGTYKVEVTATLKDGTGIVVTENSATGSKEQKVKILHAANTLSYGANGGEGGPQSSYTGGTSLNVSKDEPTREHYDFIGWNTKADGSGDSYKANDVYVFTEDGGNGGCTVTLYAQWKAKEYTVTYMADGQTVSTEKVEFGKNAAHPAVPHKDGYVGKWDRNNENITSDTVINAVYTEIPVVKPDEVKPEDKADLEDTKKQLEDMLNDDDYTEDDKKAIQDAIDAIDDALAELNKPVTDPDSPQTGDNSHMGLWIALLFISGGAVITLTVFDRKRRYTAKH